MITDERDEVIDRAARSLSALPMVNPMAVLEITSAAAVHRSMRPARARAVLGWFRRPSLSLASPAVLAGLAVRGRFALPLLAPQLEAVVLAEKVAVADHGLENLAERHRQDGQCDTRRAA